MKEAPIPDNDEARLDALQDYELLVDTPESWFDHIASVASTLCQTPIALVGLIGRDKEFFKAAHGLPPGLDSASRATTFCGHAILEDDLFEVPDALQDARFHDNPAVTGDLKFRFYAGARLVNDAGHALGTVCVLDHRPRCLTDEQRAGLKSLASVVMQNLETRRTDTFGRHLEHLFEASDDFLAVADARSLQVLHVNARLRSLISEMADWPDSSQLSVSGLFPTLSEDLLRDLAVADPDDVGSTDQVTVPILGLSESQHLVRLRVTPSKVRERHVLLLAAEDISMVLDSLRQAERSREELRKLALVARLTDNTVIITDAEGYIEWVNPSFERLTGYHHHEVTGKRPAELLQGPDTDIEARRRIAIAVTLGEAVREEILNYGRYGNRYWLDLDIKPVRDERGVLTHFVAVQTNITQRKEVENRLLEASIAAEAANEAKTAFLANVSHELRTPLNGIIGIAELLERNPVRADGTEQLATLRESADGLLELINDLLDLSRIEAGRVELDPEPFSLSHVLRSLENLLRPEAERKGIELVLEADPRLPDGLHGDSLRLRQILINLLNNAIKFTETGTVRLFVEALSSADDTVRAVFRVSDTGPGIPESAQAHIFEAFSQADSSLSRHHEGTGLGLAICQRLVRLMEGSIALDSQEGEGATFTVTLPLQTASQLDLAAIEGGQEETETPSLAADYRVLLVEDNDINRRVATAMLEELGASVVSCDSGAEGLRAFEASGFDLVLLDVQMPDMSGYDLALRMRMIESGRERRTSILAATAHSVASLDARSEAFDACISKPLTFQVLHQALTDFLVPDDEGASGEGDRPPEQTAIRSEAGDSDASGLIDEALVLRNLNGDARLVHTLTDLFERQHRHYLDLMERATQSGDTASLAEAAHQLKGAVGYFNQGELWQSVADLEKTARQGANGAVERVGEVHEQVLALAEAARHFSPGQS